MRKLIFAIIATTAAATLVGSAISTEAGTDSRPTRYVVLYDPDAAPAMRSAVRHSGGRLLSMNNRIGVATALSSNLGFRSGVLASGTVQGVARNRPIGKVRPLLRPKSAEAFLSPPNIVRRQARSSARHVDARSEPFAHLQWNMKMIHATTEGSYGRERGSEKVLVGVIDTGLDASHPDIKENFSRRLSRNFTTDIPSIDGPCVEEPDRSCSDPSDVDEFGHGTHVGSLIAAPINGVGIAGVAPGATLVNLRAGQDSAYFFVQPTVDALTYAGDHGIDVANMSYFIDPWLFNCRNNAADSPDQKAEQATIIDATQRALDYAHSRGVTLIGAVGNAHDDLAQVTADEISPTFPPGPGTRRDIDNHCLVLPEQGNNVMGTSGIGPSKTLASYSSYGYEKVTVSAPGGWFYDEPWTPDNELAGVSNMVLAAVPKVLAEALGDLDEHGVPQNPFVLRDCKGRNCGYYFYAQGTSAAAPHAVGVAALIISKHGDRRHGGISMHPFLTQAYLQATATDTPCPSPNPLSYTSKGFPPAFDAFCEGTAVYNGFYGHGIVDALAAVTTNPLG